MRIVRISYGVKGFARLYNDALKWNRMLTNKAKHKARVLVFWEKHGLEATMDAFPHKRSILFEWKKTLKKNNGNLESLNEKSRSPKNRRKRMTDQRIENFIVGLRTEHPGLGKDKVKPLLDRYCREQSLKGHSASTIGRLLQDLKNKGKIPSGRKFSFYARTGNLIEKNRIKRKKIRRKNYKPEATGDLLQVDTVVKFINGIKRYIVTAIDLKSEFAFAYGYTNPSSKGTTDFFRKLETVVPFQIKRIQTDNGSEFEHLFRDYAKQKNIIHFHNFPKCPRMNAVVERFNRTLQEEFIDWNRETLAYDLDGFNKKLIDWLLWYNTERPHWTLKQIPPMQYIINNLFLTPQKSKMAWTHTNP